MNGKQSMEYSTQQKIENCDVVVTPLVFNTNILSVKENSAKSGVCIIDSDSHIQSIGNTKSLFC